MTYFDYSATTPVSKEVLESFDKACLNYIGNPNSIHRLGVESHALIDEATEQIATLLHLKDQEIIYTSGASESNNLAIKGICDKYHNRGKHIITTNFEHSSIYGPLSYLQRQGYEVDIVDCDETGRVDIEHLKSLLREDTILVSITAVNSEIGIINQIEEIGLLLKSYRAFFHVDMTQAITKIKMDTSNIDLFSFSAHKFFGIKGIGALIKKKSIILEPLIHGGKSTTIYRSGTPALPLIVSLSKALRLALEDMDNKYLKVQALNTYLEEGLRHFPKVTINSNQYCSPYIINFSLLGVKPETFVHALEERDVYISTQTACSSNNTLSRAVNALTKNEELATHSMRISMSSLTTKEDCVYFLQAFEKCYQQLTALEVK